MMYLDTESTGLDFKKDRLATIQTITPIEAAGSPIIVRSIWDHDGSEAEMVSRFFAETEYHKPHLNRVKWERLPVGWNLSFEHRFLYEKGVRYGIIEPFAMTYADFVDRPMLDLQSFGVMWAGGFKGSGLNNWSKKSTNGSMLPTWIANGQKDEVFNYVIKESEAFRLLFLTLRDTMGEYWNTVASRMGLAGPEDNA